MNDEIQRMLDDLTPCAAPRPLRDRVLAAASRELNSRPSWHRRHRTGLAFAASLLLAVALNWAVAAREDRLQAALGGLRHAPEYLAAGQKQSASDAIDAMRVYREMIIHLANSRGMGDVKTQEGVQVDRNHHRPVGGNRTSDQRHFGLAERLTA